MNTSATIFAFLLLGIILTSTLYVLFGQITVRKLRKKPIMKNELGIELVSGWDIITVAQSLSLPSNLITKLRRTPLAYLYIDKQLLQEHTSKFDRFLGKLFYWSFTTTGLCLIGWACLDGANVFK